MKNLDLNVLGVQEMDAEEMRVMDGGLWLATAKLVAMGLVYELVTEGPSKCWEDFKKGFKSV